jgi:hypothetical protein
MGFPSKTLGFWLRNLLPFWEASGIMVLGVEFSSRELCFPLKTCGDKDGQGLGRLRKL